MQNRDLLTETGAIWEKTSASDGILSMVNERAIADCFDHEVACCTPKVLRKKRSRSRALADAVEATGIHGMTVLEIGSGVGELTREFVRRGAKAATGIDLSPESVATAVAASRSERLTDKVMFRVGNGATDRLDPHDVVVLDRVICCYPRARELVSHTVNAARHIYAFTMPRNEGALRLYWTCAFWIENAYHASRRRQFRAYLHEINLIDRWLRDRGFVPGRRFSKSGWLHAVYVREA
jgi:2-polyprenyl-3-methyl-5-hydroxy-6-metoxy-1,4-benzoquinol methylase